eukprot:EG_transcript_24214
MPLVCAVPSAALGFPLFSSSREDFDIEGNCEDSPRSGSARSDATSLAKGETTWIAVSRGTVHPLHISHNFKLPHGDCAGQDGEYDTLDDSQSFKMETVPETVILSTPRRCSRVLQRQTRDLHVTTGKEEADMMPAAEVSFTLSPTAIGAPNTTAAIRVAVAVSPVPKPSPSMPQPPPTPPHRSSVSSSPRPPPKTPSPPARRSTLALVRAEDVFSLNHVPQPPRADDGRCLPASKADHTPPITPRPSGVYRRHISFSIPQP